ncbi:MAG: hypothetical protein ACE5D7_01375 [Fidelibacterota bacterium]
MSEDGQSNDQSEGQDDQSAASQISDMVNQDQNQDQNQQNQSVFNYAEGIPGQGTIPDWFKSDKYATVSDQARAYKELEGKMGAFTGAPDKYEIVLSQEITERGIEIKEDDPLYEEAIKFATESNMNQDGFNDMMNLYATAKIAENEALENFKKDEIAALGVNGQERINNLISWGKTNLPTDLFEGFEEMPVSAVAVQALEKIISMTRAAPISPDNVNGGKGGVSHEELTKMQFEKDEHGNRRIQTDPAFKARYEKLKGQIWGNDDHRIVVGAK